MKSWIIALMQKAGALPKMIPLVLIFLGLLGFPIALAQSNAGAYTTGYRYDFQRKLLGMIAPDPDGPGPLRHAAVRNTYDANGLLVRVETGELANWQPETVAPSAWPDFTVFRYVQTVYDARGRKVSEAVYANGAIFALKQYSYDIAERVRCETVRMNPAVFGAPPADACALGPEGLFGPDRITRYTYDFLGRVILVEKAVGVPGLQQDYQRLTLNAQGKPRTIRDAKGNVTTLIYDGFGRLSRMTFPSKTQTGVSDSGDFEEYGYDANNNRTSLRKRDGQVLYFAYDGLNRVISKDVPGGAATDVYYGYDLRGLQTFARFGSSSGQGITSIFDGFGRLSSSSITQGGGSLTLSYLYDRNSNRTRVTHPDGVFFTYSYDGLNRMTSIRENDVTSIASYSYDNQGRRGRLVVSGVVTNFGYDPISRLASITHDPTGTADDVTFSQSHSPANQILSKDISLASFRHTGQGSATGGYSVNGLNQYTSVSGRAHGYDANGNLTSDGLSSFAYDAENRLVSANGAGNAALVYDPAGRLFEFFGGGITTRFLYDGDALVGEYALNGALWRRYVHGPGVDAPVVWYEGSGLGDRRGLLADHQGSIIGVSDAGGGVLYRNSYEEYGAPGQGNGGRFAYTGQIVLPELALLHYKARAYSPALGRFLQTDPVGYEDDLNLYAYVANDPLNKTDPTGLYTCQGGKSTCSAIRNYVNQVGQAANIAAKQDPKSETARSLQAVVKFIGKEGEGGPTIKAGNIKSIGRYSPNSNSITLNLTKISSAEATGKTYTGAATVAHEGQHGVDRANGVNPGNSIGALYDAETRAYGTDYETQKALGQSPGNKTAYVSIGSRDSVRNECRDLGGCGD